MKKALINLIDICLQSRNKAKSDNSLDSDAQALIDESIRALTELRARAEAEPDTVGVDSIVNEVRDIMDEKIAAALEKVKSLKPAEDSANSYLESRQAVVDFARCLRSTNGLNAMRAAWNECLKTNGIIDASTAQDFLLPAAVRGRIEDNWKSDTNWLRRLNNTGAKRFLIRHAVEGQDDANVRARYHKEEGGEPTKKTEQTVTMNDRDIIAGPVYKLQRLSSLTVFNDDGALVEWIADELSRQVFYTIGRSILIGNADVSAVASIISIFADSQDVNAASYVHNVTTWDPSDLVASVMEQLIQPIYDGGDLALFMSKEDLFALRKYSTAGGTTRYAGIDEIKDMLGVSDIITLPYLSATVQGTPRMIAMHLDKYYTVGRMQNIEYLRFPDHLTNSEYFRAETFVGGAAGLGCASIYTNA